MLSYAEGGVFLCNKTMVRRVYPAYLLQISLYVVCIPFTLIGIRSTYYSIYNQYAESLYMRKSYHEVEEKGLLHQSALTNVYDPARLVEETLKMTRIKIKLELWNYNFTYSGVNRLEDLVMESGGKPLRSVILATWRSGSSFMGELLNAIPSNYYNFEPLGNYNDTQLRRPPEISQAIEDLKSLFKCNYNKLKDYLKLSKIDPKHFRRNTRLEEQCQIIKEFCFESNVASKLCELYPFQVTKLVRLRLSIFEDILMDNELNVKAVLLVRDPRAVMESRRRVKFCQGPDCSDPKLLCADMVSDHKAAERLLPIYPGRLRVVRYEDFILNLRNATQELLKFFRLGPTRYVDDFISMHSTVANSEIYSTFRVSRKVPFKWKSYKNFKYVKKIQMACKEAMKLWGYQWVHNASHMASKDIHPLLPFSFTKK